MTEGRDFWSRRRAAVAAEETRDAKTRPAAKDGPAAQNEEERARLEAASDEELLEELGLPEPESLSAGDDFSAFLKKTVPDRLRRRALRALWKTNPVLANVDGLVDYNEDYTDSATVFPDIKTAYQVGKGMMGHVEKLSARLPEPDPEPQEDAAPVPEEVAETAGETVQDREPEVEPDPEDAYVAAPRRMVFTFDGDTG